MQSGENEKDRSKEQLSTLKQVDQFKTAVTGDVGEYKKFLKDQQEFIDKLTGNSKFQGNFGEKFLEQLLQMQQIHQMQMLMAPNLLPFPFLPLMIPTDSQPSPTDPK